VNDVFFDKLTMQAKKNNDSYGQQGFRIPKKKYLNYNSLGYHIISRRGNNIYEEGIFS
jgi:hypothetical protein